MNSALKVLVVDHGTRPEVDGLATQLAERGVMSVTTSLEAADDVLGMIDTPSAIVLRMPRARTTEYHAFLVLADRLRRRDGTADVPVLLWDELEADNGNGLSSILARAAATSRATLPAA